MSITVHPTAFVHPSARIGEGSRIGAFTIVESEVEIGRGCDIQDHVVIRSFTRIGNETRIFPFAVLGGDPQHLKYKGEPTTLDIGHRVTIRESVTIHRGTVFGMGTTQVGDEAYLMAYTHVGHDSKVGKGVILANGVQLAGHTEVHDYAFIGGLTGVPQFTRIGAYSYIGGCSMPRKDVPPFLCGKGMEFRVQGINVVGLTRKGFSREKIERLRALYRIFFHQNLTVSAAIEKTIMEVDISEDVQAFLDFVRASKAGIVRRV